MFPPHLCYRLAARTCGCRRGAELRGKTLDLAGVTIDWGPHARLEGARGGQDEFGPNAEPTETDK
jgi:hypothetical protein